MFFMFVGVCVHILCIKTKRWRRRVLNGSQKGISDYRQSYMMCILRTNRLQIRVVQFSYFLSLSISLHFLGLSSSRVSESSTPVSKNTTPAQFVMFHITSMLKFHLHIYCSLTFSRLRISWSYGSWFILLCYCNIATFIMVFFFFSFWNAKAHVEWHHTHTCI